MSDDVHLVMDETAIVAIGAGDRMVSRLIHRAHNDPGWYLYAPACALVEADRIRPGLAEYVAGMPAVVLLELNLPAVLALGGAETTWAQAHARFAAEPTPELPDGAFVATMDPDRWEGQPVRLFDLNP
ncbi:MAG: hypothetical protein JF587_19460 [Catenulisporales bacterium]|nr:hypothetical protein [Catenulisporales bacterium]